MISKNEMRILEKLIGNLSSEFTLSDVSRMLRQKYPQSYKSIGGLLKKGLIRVKKVGKSKVIELEFSRYHPEYAIAEMERLNKIIKNNGISVILNRILKVDKMFICVLFGSYASGKPEKDSDIDLIFIIPDEYDAGKFGRLIRNNLSMYNADINIITEDSLFEMWASPKKLNVGNELLKNHIVLSGAEQFINLVRKRHVGR